MAAAITKQAEAYLEALAEALEIPRTRYERAEKSYNLLVTGYIGTRPVFGTTIQTSSYRALSSSAPSSDR